MLTQVNINVPDGHTVAAVVALRLDTDGNVEAQLHPAPGADLSPIATARMLRWLADAIELEAATTPADLTGPTRPAT